MICFLLLANTSRSVVIHPEEKLQHLLIITLTRTPESIEHLICFTSYMFFLGLDFVELWSNVLCDGVLSQTCV